MIDRSSMTYGAAMLNIDEYWTRGILGKGIKIGIVDDGMASHEATPISGGYACGPLTSYTSTTDTHPIHCAGIAMGRNLKNGKPSGIAPEAELYAIRMYHKTYEDRVRSLIEAIDYAISKGIHILSMSIHIAENSYNRDDGKGSSRGCPKHMRIPMRKAFMKAYKNNVSIVVAAGNNNDGSRKDNMEFEELLPKMPGVISVANMTMVNVLRKSSGVGRWVDLSGYGSYINSCAPGDKYSLMTGTSMATPQVAGIIALYKCIFPELDLPKLYSKIFDNCEPIPGISKMEQGRGIIRPPKELYDIPTYIEDDGIFRTWSSIDYTWAYTDSYFRLSNDDSWKEMRGVSYG